MIEIKIPTSAAVLLLKEKMIIELESLQHANLVPSHYSLQDLTEKEFAKLIETAAFDLIFSLPAEIYVDDSNIADIIQKSVHSFGITYEIEELKLYTLEDAEKFVGEICDFFGIHENGRYLDYR